MSDAEKVERAIRDACFAIAADWADSLHGRRQAGPGLNVTVSKEPPPPVPLATLDDRAECCTRLAGWALVILEERDLHANLDGGDAVGLARFVDTHAGWLAEHDAGGLVASELGDSARKLGRLARPERRDYIVIGECPVTIADPHGERVACGAKVRAYAEKNIIRCPMCGTEDTLDWWESRIVPNLEDKPRLTVGELVMFLHQRTGRQVLESTIRQWAQRGHVGRYGKDVAGRTLYDHREVLAFVQEKERAA